MAKKNTEGLQAGESTAPRLKMGEIGSVGLAISNKQIVEESRKELQWPNNIKTYKEMQKDTTISSAINVFKLMLSRIDWNVKAPEGASEIQEKKAKFIKECMNDMDQTWHTFIQDVSSSYVYGFSVHEKVYRRRYKTEGSKYNDGLVGWANLPIRSQDTVSGWLFSEDGRKLIAVEQDLSLLRYYNRYSNLIAASGDKVEIPRKKFLLFRVNPERNNPEGNSLLKSCYLSYRYRSAIEETEALGMVKNLSGVPLVEIPAQYLSPDATAEQKAVADYYKNMVRNLERNEQSGIVLPRAFDYETKQKLFDFQLLSVNAGNQYDTTAMINRYDNKILTALFADFLRMGQDQVGSFSLAGAKTNLMSLAIEARLKEIVDVLNNDLIPQTFALNGWDDTEFPEISYSDLDEEDLDELGKFIQRVFSVNAIEFDREIANIVRKRGFGASEYEKDKEVDEDLLPNNRSRAGDGMAKGGGNGTSDETASTDTSSNNMENAS
jgi:hypothetical protein